MGIGMLFSLSLYAVTVAVLVFTGAAPNIGVGIVLAILVWVGIFLAAFAGVLAGQVGRGAYDQIRDP